MVYTLRFFSLQNTVCFIILTYFVPVLFTFYIQGVLKLKKYRHQKVNGGGHFQGGIKIIYIHLLQLKFSDSVWFGITISILI